MKRHYRFASVLLTTMLALSGPALAHEGNDDGNGGWNGQAMHQDGQEHHWMLSKEKRDLLHKTMKATMEKDKPLIEQMHKLHKQQHDILKASKFDSQAFLSVNAEIEKLHDQLHANRVEAFASIAGQFTPKEREMLAKHFEHHHGHHMGGHHGMGGSHHMGGPGHDGNAWRERPAEDVSPAQTPADDRAYPPYPSK